MNDFRKKLEFCIQKSVPNQFKNNEIACPTIDETKKLELLNNREIARKLLQGYNTQGFEETFNLLNDDYSRELLVNIFAYKFFLGPTKVKLPLSDPNLWIEMFDIERLCMKDELLQLSYYKFNLFDLNPIGHDYRIFTTKEGLFTAYGLKEYEYHKNNVHFKVEEGDYLIDGGAFIGDTALYFADAVGEKGKVFSFEFEDVNLEIFNKNIGLNPRLKDRIVLLENALWSNSKEFLYVVAAGPGTSVTMEEPPKYSKKIPSKSIDDLVEEQNMTKIDFIKLDVEGAEMEGLKGAKKTIDKFKPKLAVCLYHKPEDFTTIPQYINELHPYYDFYINHHTAFVWETVLYAVPKPEFKTK